MQQDFELGKWIREKWKSQVAFSTKLGVNQARVSKWLSLTEGVSPDYQAKIRKMGYTGPWPREEAKEAAAPAGVSEREIGKLEGRIEALERQLERLAEGFRHHMTKEPGEAHPQARG